MSFRENIYQARVSRGWTQERMAIELGIKTRMYGRIESGDTKKIDVSVYRLAKEKFGIIDESEAIEVPAITQLELVKIKANIQALNQIVARNMALQTGKPIQECLNEIVEITQTNLTNLSL